MNYIKLLLIFITISLFGWLYEYIIFGKDAPDNIGKKLFNINLPILPLYGFIAVVLYTIHHLYKSESMFIKLIIAFLLINTIECSAGIASFYFNKYQTWKYDNSLIPFCYNYISVGTSIFWTMLSYIFFLTLDYYNLYLNTRNTKKKIKDSRMQNNAMKS